MEGRGERCCAISLQGTKMVTSSAPGPDAGMCLGAGAPTHRWMEMVSPGRPSPPHGPRGWGRTCVPVAPACRELRTWLCSGHSAITRSLIFPPWHKANSEVVPSRGANGREGFPGHVAISCRSRLPSHPHWCHPPTARARAAARAQDRSPWMCTSATLGAGGVVAMELLRVLGRMGDAFGLCHNCLFRPLTILSVLGLIRLIFAPWFALEMAPPFPGR